MLFNLNNFLYQNIFIILDVFNLGKLTLTENGFLVPLLISQLLIINFFVLTTFNSVNVIKKVSFFITFTLY